DPCSPGSGTAAPQRAPDICDRRGFDPCSPGSGTAATKESWSRPRPTCFDPCSPGAGTAAYAPGRHPSFTYEVSLLVLLDQAPRRRGRAPVPVLPGQVSILVLLDQAPRPLFFFNMHAACNLALILGRLNGLAPSTSHTPFSRGIDCCRNPEPL